jgi:hypothetical protein
MLIITWQIIDATANVLLEGSNEEIELSTPLREKLSRTYNKSIHIYLAASKLSRPIRKV